ncbi:DUF4167 domain-containing protein [Pseudaestuariivita atlantica]|uniref:Nucleoside triphosphate hydrolase n=1 Tax=Pseudaestuariivita atlantica TaxID=1317121 RepID=A0A0L1JLT0_9RHOB|nr:DUF4167 domain-containing protein [Pseudaestuariivita atlantica]KNG92363.1 nucleoside triphosphate hydrolase [Pseudaestuariivita atlantica]
MRSSKSRSRSKGNRNRSVGNVVNRVFDSSGPEGKVRGTPQQIIDKYNQLARDAQLSGDRVATENFQQHAEHYLRMLGEAQKEQDARREEQERQNRERQAQRDRDRAERQERESNGQQGGGGNEGGQPDPAEAPQPDVLEFTSGGSDGDSGLVETPENADAKPKRSRSRSSRKPAPKGDASSDDAPKGDGGAPEAAE